ncbi:ATP-binding response regulator [Methanocalculus chunghsingensis]|uniref:ATP-binding response regulator n=1 Tax=Methanocalculus chunghsingensis TaxID=156457 RepID=UPI001B8B563E|nr:response regulator [Methanocalculus chunghsingensis]
MTGDKTNILVVEDDPLITEVLSIMLVKHGYSICGTARSGEEAIMQVVEKHPDLVLMDIGLDGECDGIAAAMYIFQFFSIPVIFSTGHSGGDFIQRAKHAQPFGYLTKPFSDCELYSTIEIALNSFEMLSDRIGLKKRRLRELLHLDEGIIFLDTNGRCLFINPYTEHLIHLSHREVFYRHIHDVLDYEPSVSRARIPPLWDLIRESIAIGTSHDILVCSSGGRKRPVHLTVKARRNSRGVHVGYILRMEERIRTGYPIAKKAVTHE